MLAVHMRCEDLFKQRIGHSTLLDPCLHGVSVGSTGISTLEGVIVIIMISHC